MHILQVGGLAGKPRTVINDLTRYLLEGIIYGCHLLPPPNGQRSLLNGLLGNLYFFRRILDLQADQSHVHLWIGGDRQNAYPHVR